MNKSNFKFMDKEFIWFKEVFQTEKKKGWKK